MPKIKHTARKIPVGLPTACRPYVCPECQKELSDASNLRRHRIVLHRRNDDGSVADEATVARFKGYTRRGTRAQPTTVTATGGPIPSTSAGLTKPRHQHRSRDIVKREESTTTSSSATSIDVAKDLEVSSDDSSNDFFVDITDEEGTAGTSIAEIQPTVPAPTERKPTRPMPITTPRVRAATKESSTVRQLPPTTFAAAKRRRLELAPSVLAHKVIMNPNKSSRDLVDDLASKYSWSPMEQRDRVNVIRGMRAMAATFSARIRRRLPLNRTDEDVQRFLTAIEDECQLMEGHVSDEFSG